MATKFNAAFWRWFGDSKVVDAKGQPLVVYHGTVFNFTRFKKRPARSRGSGQSLGFYFTPSPEQAERFAVKISSDQAVNMDGAVLLPVYLRIEHPFLMSVAEYVGMFLDDFGGEYLLSSGEEVNVQSPSGLRAFMREVKSYKYDGIVVEAMTPEERSSVTQYGDEFAFPQFIAFRAGQIKSATGNDGTWDADDHDIRSNPPEILRLFHVTPEKNIPAIRKKGIRPQRKVLWTGGLGQRLSLKDAIYAFDNFDDAARWAYKTQWDTHEPVVILSFYDPSPLWQHDPHWQASGAKGMWLMRREWVKGQPAVVEPKQIEGIITVDEKIVRGLVKTLGEPLQVMPDGSIAKLEKR